MSLNQVSRKALKLHTFYYFDDVLNRWVADFMFYMPKSDLIHAEEFNQLRTYKQKASAIRRAEQVAAKYNGEYLGYIADMEI